ncbi:glycine rich domain-containing protein [Clostridioides difficile]|uniref:glycine rich domain-containing protein n=1 Tax=Clostridioides difficile TaxID=1496 RepID=UPI0021C92D59|nr:glycine rich domain-containing protein [Clostridioides difficile]UUV13133.1 glycine rich domain-containing protein [Clostridioides difficile]
MQTEWNFDFKAEAQPIILKPGKYKLECWGAFGRVWSGDSPSNGGYSYGELTLKKETTLYVYTGAFGSSNNYETFTFNGGGLSVNSGGGGATDIRLNAGDWNNEQGLLSRIIVAGGGGGGYSKTPTGKGGGFKGGNSTNDGNSSMLIVPGGTQYDGGRGYYDEWDGVFGCGGGSILNLQREKYPYNSGGGGWFGGAGAKVTSSGGGGSGYVLTKDSYKPIGYIPTSEYWLENIGSITGGNTTKVNGYAKITLLQALPFLTVSSYNSTQATFKADHTDPTLLTKIEVFIDDISKETITTDLTLEKTINYTLEDNALHTLKIVVTDSANATAEKVLSISKNIMPLPENVNLNDISTKLTEVNAGFKTGKTSIINTLALKNIDASLNNTLAELSEKIKTSFDSSDASSQELQNRITELTNQLSQRKKWASGTYTFTQNDYDNFYVDLESGTKTLEINLNLDFVPRLIVVENFTFKVVNSSTVVKYPKICSDSYTGFVGWYVDGRYDYFGSWLSITKYSSASFTLGARHTGRLNGESKFVCRVGESFTWYAFE